jgi:GH24 family phage-related lysozyme (muramidase)
MNWYKKAQKNNWTWAKFLATFGTAAIMSLSTAWGMGESEIRNKFEANPQQVISSAIDSLQNKQNLTEQKPKELSNKGFNISQSLYDMIERHEGKRNTVYRDTGGIPHIGIGFNLSRGDAPSLLSNLGLEIKDVLNGKKITEEQIYKLFHQDVNTAINGAIAFLPSFNNQPQIVQNILVDMIFNMGLNKMNKFKNFRDALEKRDYQKAANEMVNSGWYNQVGIRAKELVQLMKGV